MHRMFVLGYPLLKVLVPPKHFFYLARCGDNSLYAGYTTDLKQREQAHNEGKGAKYTRAKGPVKIVYREQYKTSSGAKRREALVKRMSKKQKEELVQQVPVCDLQNLGPATQEWLARIEVHTKADLEALGPLEAYRQLKPLEPDCNLMMLWAMVGALMEIDCMQLPKELKEQLKRELKY